MKRHLITVTVITLCLMVASPNKVAADRLTVVASVFPLFDFAQEVAGPDADVRLLLPPGVDPHSWEPKPSDIVEVSRADIFLYTGEEMEPWAASIVNAVKGKDIVIVQVMNSPGFESEDITHTEAGVSGAGEDHGEDPHFWLDPSLSERAAWMVGKTLSKNDPENSDSYTTRTLDYAGKLKELDRIFEEGLSNCKSRKLVTGGHAAFGHLARRYGLEQVSVYGLSPDAEPSPRHLAGIVSAVKDNKVRTVFSEELMNPRMAEVLSQETGAKVMTLNPGANLIADQWRRGVTFLDIMKQNLENLREGLGCE